MTKSVETKSIAIEDIKDDFDLKKAELALKHMEIQAKIEGEKKGLWFTSPLIVGALSAIFGLLGTGVGAALQGYWNTQLERQKFEAGLINKALEPNDFSERAKQLKFYVDIGLITDTKVASGVAGFVNKTPREIPQVITSSETLGAASPAIRGPERYAAYQKLYDTMVIRPEKKTEVNWDVSVIKQNESRYKSVEKATGIPWQVVGVLHYLEGGSNFNLHLHNGDPLIARTVHEPRGRPISGKPPFTWEESAIDCFRFENLDHWRDWSISGTLYKLEDFNGVAYRQHGVNSPYLWSCSNHYSSGRYIADGRFSQTEVARNVGAAVILKAMSYAGR